MVVDLGKVRDRELYHHIWVFVRNYRVSDETMADLYANHVAIKQALAIGEPPPEFSGQLQLSEVQLDVLESIGCTKCLRSWQDAYEELCSITDAEFLVKCGGDPSAALVTPGDNGKIWQ